MAVHAMPLADHATLAAQTFLAKGILSSIGHAIGIVLLVIFLIGGLLGFLLGLFVGKRR